MLHIQSNITKQQWQVMKEYLYVDNEILSSMYNLGG